MDIGIYYSNDSLDSKQLANMLLDRLKGYQVRAKLLSECEKAGFLLNLKAEKQ